MKQGTLFKNPERDTRPVPRAVIKELVDVWGMNPRAARALAFRAAFARLYALRRKALAHTGAALKATAAEMQKALHALAQDEYARADDLTEATVAALAVLDSDRLRRVAAGLANLCGEIAK